MVRVFEMLLEYFLVLVYFDEEFSFDRKVFKERIVVILMENCCYENDL